MEDNVIVLVLAAESLDELSGMAKEAADHLIEVVTNTSGLPTWIPLSELDLPMCLENPIRVERAWSGAGIKTVGDLYEKGPEDLLKVSGVGPAILQSALLSLRRLCARNPIDVARLEHWFAAETKDQSREKDEGV